MGLGYETYREFLDLLVERLLVAMGEGRLLSCCLFGSVARGEARVDSDIDLLLVYGEGCDDLLGPHRRNSGPRGGRKSPCARGAAG